MQLENSKVGIVVITYNNKDIFLKHIQRIKRHCKDDNYEIVIIDNSTDLKVIDHIKYHSKVNGCEYIKTNASSLNGSSSHSFAANISYLLLKEKYTHFFYLDHDCFPIKDFSVVEILGEKQFAGIGQEKSKTYLWPGCLMFKKRDDIDFSPLPGLDTGGSLYKAMETVGAENIVSFNELHQENPEFNKNMYNFYSLINDSMFMHFINASGWNKNADQQERINSLLNILEKS
jgi:hypothetical protein